MTCHQMLLAVTILLVVLFIGGCTAVEKSQPKEETESESSQVAATKASDSQVEVSSTEIEKETPEKKRNKALDDYLKTLSHQPLGIAIQTLNDKETYQVKGDKRFYGASVAKLPGILYTLERLKANEISLSDQYPYTTTVHDIPGAMVAGGTGSLQHTVVEGQYISLEELLRHAIVESDNLASNMLGYYIAEQNGSEFLNFLENYYGEELQEFTKELSATTAMKLMSRIYSLETANEWLAETNWANEKIGSLPKKVLHKIGINGGYNHDVGIVTGGQPYVIAILTDGLSNQEIEEIVKECDRLISQYK